jgi:hypothetical protein
VCVSTFSFFLREKGVRLGLFVEGEGGRLGLVLLMVCLRLQIPFSIGVSSKTGKKQAVLKCVSPRSVPASWSRLGFSSIHSNFLAHFLIDRKGARPLEKGALKFAWLMERNAPSWKGRAQFAWLMERGAPSWKGRAQFAWLMERGTPLLIRARPRKVALLETYWFSIQYPDGVVQVVTTKGVAVSITGCRLRTGLSQIFFYRQPSRQASTKCPLPALKQLNFQMQIPHQLSCFMNWSNNHYDPDFSLTVCDISGWPYWGHEAASEDTMLKRGGGVCGFLWPWCEGGRWNSCWGRLEEGAPGYVSWRGKVQLKCGRLSFAGANVFVYITDAYIFVFFASAYVFSEHQ